MPTLNLPRVRAMHQRYKAGLSLDQVGAEFGVTGSAVQMAFKRQGLPRRACGVPPTKQNAWATIAHVETPRAARQWCEQCERSVYGNEAAACQDRFCRAKAAAA